MRISSLGTLDEGLGNEVESVDELDGYLFRIGSDEHNLEKKTRQKSRGRVLVKTSIQTRICVHGKSQVAKLRPALSSRERVSNFLQVQLYSYSRYLPGPDTIRVGNETKREGSHCRKGTRKEMGSSRSGKHCKIPKVRYRR